MNPDKKEPAVQTPAETGLYVIQWRNKINGRNGRGTKTFPQAEAYLLAQELNDNYPDIEHEAVPV